MMLSSVEREHLLQQISSRPVGHQGAEMRLKPVQLRCRPAMRWGVSKTWGSLLVGFGLISLADA